MASRSEVTGIPLYVGNGHSGRSSVAAGYDLWSPDLRKTVLAASPRPPPWLQHTRCPLTHVLCELWGTLLAGTWSQHCPTVPRLPAAPGLKSKLPMRVHLSTCTAGHL